jgi:hypothetical protein
MVLNPAILDQSKQLPDFPHLCVLPSRDVLAGD